MLDALVRCENVSLHAIAVHGANGSYVHDRRGGKRIALVDGRLYQVEAPLLEETDHRGAGDSMTAGLAVGLARQMGTEDMLRLAGACGALNVTRHAWAPDGANGSKIWRVTFG